MTTPPAAHSPLPSPSPSPALLDIGALSFENAMGELEQIIRNLENGKISLEESISAYERGVALKNHCEAKLNDARMKIEKISLGPNGALSVQPFEE